jgi:hypothetical protein
VVLNLLAPSDARYLPPQIVEALKPPAPSKTAEVADGDSDDDGEPDDGRKKKSKEASTSKKDPVVRRREVLSAIAIPLTSHCTAHAGYGPFAQQ